MPPRKKAASKAKNNNKRKAPEPAAEPANDGAGPSAPAADQAADPTEATEEAQGQAEQENSLEDRRRTALALLLQLGLPEERASRALDATAEEHSGEAETWAEEAGVWLALDNECADESYAMGAAMEISLVEAEERKATEKPLIEQAGKEIIEKFNTSELLDAIRRGLSKATAKMDTPNDKQQETTAEAEGKPIENAENKEKTIDSDVISDFIDNISDNSTLKKVLVDYLLMEQRCKKWYGCSRGYFANFSEGIQSRIEEIERRKENDDGEKEGKNSTKGEETDAIAAANTNINNIEGAGPSSVAATTPVLIEISVFLLASLTTELAALEEAVFKQPESDTAGPPAIFAAYANVQEEVDLVDA